jgi:hypothetical protein
VPEPPALPEWTPNDATPAEHRHPNAPEEEPSLSLAVVHLDSYNTSKPSSLETAYWCSTRDWGIITLDNDSCNSGGGNDGSSGNSNAEEKPR